MHLKSCPHGRSHLSGIRCTCIQCIPVFRYRYTCTENDRKSVVFCKRPARMELFRDAVFASRRIAPSLTGRQSFFFDLSFQARGVCPPPNDETIQYKFTVRQFHTNVKYCTLQRNSFPLLIRRCVFQPSCEFGVGSGKLTNESNPETSESIHR